MIIKKRSDESIEKIIQFYESVGYNGGAKEDDHIFLVYEIDELIAVVRICEESESLVLRGMYMKEKFRGGKRGRRILKFVESFLIERNEECFCIPFEHLIAFYEQIHFQEIDPDSGPEFLLNRYKKYVKAGQKVIMMKRVRSG